MVLWWIIPSITQLCSKSMINLLEETDDASGLGVEADFPEP